MNNPTIQAAIIAGVVALLVAVFSQVISVINQVLSHRLTVRRENQKYFNEVYQKFFAPVISDAFIYMDMVSNFRRGHDTTPEQEDERLTKVLNHISTNTLYTSPKLLSAYHEMVAFRYKDDRGVRPDEYDINILLAFINEYEHAIRQSSIYGGNSNKGYTEIVEYYKVMYLVWLVFITNVGHEDAEVLLGYSHLYDRRFMNARMYRKLSKFLVNKNGWGSNQKAMRRIVYLLVRSKENRETLKSWYDTPAPLS